MTQTTPPEVAFIRFPVSPEEKAAMQAAAAREGRLLRDFVRDAAMERAREVRRPAAPTEGEGGEDAAAA